MFWNKEAEKMKQQDLEVLQLERLRYLIKLTYAKVEFYRERFEKKGLSVKSVQSLADLAKFPFITKQDIIDQMPYGLMTAPLTSAARFHALCDDAGNVIITGYTKDDIEMFKEVTARGLVAGGLTTASVVQIALEYGMSSGAFAVHDAAVQIGAAVLPVGCISVSSQMKLLELTKATAIVADPLHILALSDAEDAQNPNLEFLTSIFYWTEKINSTEIKKIKDKFGDKAYQLYGSTEVLGPGVAAECHVHQGLHVQEDHFYPEIINPASGEVLPDGDIGELVITTLSKQTMPLVRYRTGDMAYIVRGRCECGRTTARIFFAS